MIGIKRLRFTRPHPRVDQPDRYGLNLSLRPIVIILMTLGFAHGAAAKVGAARVGLLHELRACRREMESHKLYYESPCAKMDVSGLVGASRAQIFRALGLPSYCIMAKDPYADWSDAACCTATGVGYLFYMMGKDVIGGGPQLELQFDAARMVRSAKWIWTQ